jgi:hypothetical protein
MHFGKLFINTLIGVNAGCMYKVNKLQLWVILGWPWKCEECVRYSQDVSRLSVVTSRDYSWGRSERRMLYEHVYDSRRLQSYGWRKLTWFWLRQACLLYGSWHITAVYYFAYPGFRLQLQKFKTGLSITLNWTPRSPDLSPLYFRP